MENVHLPLGLAYTPEGTLDTITDADGNLTRVLRDAAGALLDSLLPQGEWLLPSIHLEISPLRASS